MTETFIELRESDFLVRPSSVKNANKIEIAR